MGLVPNVKNQGAEKQQNNGQNILVALIKQTGLSADQAGWILTWYLGSGKGPHRRRVCAMCIKQFQCTLFNYRNQERCAESL